MLGIRSSSLKATVGQTWSSISHSTLSSAGGQTRTLVYANGYYVVHLRNQDLAYATHPSGPWTRHSNTSWANNDITQITYQNGYWFFPTRGTTSKYMVNIGDAPTSFTNNSLRKVIWHSGSSQWVGINGGSGYSLATTVSTWSASATWTAGAITDIDTDGTTLVMVTNAGELYTSTSPTTALSSWTSRTSSFGTTSIRNVTYNASAGYWVATGDNGTLAYSTNATTWTQKATGVTGTSASVFNDIVYFNGKWFINDLTNDDVIASSGSNPSTSTYSVVLDGVSDTQYIGASDTFIWTLATQGTTSTTLWASR